MHPDIKHKICPIRKWQIFLFLSCLPFWRPSNQLLLHYHIHAPTNQTFSIYYRNYFQALISFNSLFALVFHSFSLLQHFLSFLLHVAIISCFFRLTSHISAPYINIDLKLTHNILSFFCRYFSGFSYRS